MRLGFGAGGETMRLENGDGGGDGNYLHFYVASTIPQMPLSEIDGMVNLFFARRAKKRHLIFGPCWRDCSARCEIKFSGGQITCLLSRDRNLFCVLIENDSDKMLLTLYPSFHFFSYAPVYISDELVVAFLVFHKLYTYK
jgi:hypothetical protein